MLTGVIGSRALPSVLSSRETIAIRSIGIVGIINGQKIEGYIPVTCKATDRSGLASGCGIYAKQTLHIKKMAAGLFHGPKATGCLVAAGKWHGTVTTGQTIPIKFLWTGNC